LSDENHISNVIDAVVINLTSEQQQK